MQRNVEQETGGVTLGLDLNSEKETPWGWEG